MSKQATSVERPATLMSHAGYQGTGEVSLEDGCLHGRVLHINDLVTYEAETVAGLVEQFKAAVDDYLAHCREVGKQPDRPYTGSFNVRLGPDRHRRLVESAEAAGISLNEQLCRVIDRFYAKGSKGASTSSSRPVAQPALSTRSSAHN